jgi:hypothetical protein
MSPRTRLLFVAFPLLTSVALAAVMPQLKTTLDCNF